MTRIGVINNQGWLLTLTPGPLRPTEISDQGHYQRISKQENLRDINDYEEVSSLDEENNNNIQPVKNSNLRTRENVARKFSQVVPNDEAISEETVKRLEVSEDILHQYAGSPVYRDHPIHSLTESDIEKAVRGRGSGRGGVREGGQLACYTLAITLAIVLIVAVVFIVSNIVSNMYIKY